MFVVYLWIRAALALIFKLFSYVCFKDKMTAASDFLSEGMLFATPLSLALNVLFEFLIAGYVMMSVHIYDTQGEIIGAMFSWFGLSLSLLLAPICIIYFIKQPNDRFENMDVDKSEDEIVERLKPLLENHRVGTRTQRSYYLYWMARRIIMVTIAFIITQSERSFIQLHVLLISNLAWAWFVNIAGEISIQRSHRRWEMALEYFISMCCI